jgi:hypothetical protein
MSSTKKATHAQGDKEARIQHIESLMRSFTWRRGKTYRELAREWDLSEDTVRQYSAEASRRIRAAIMDPTEVNAAVGAALEEALSQCVTDGNWKLVSQLCDTWAKISGAAAPAKHEIEASLNADPAKAAALVREMFGGNAAKSDDADDDPPGSASAV